MSENSELVGPIEDLSESELRKAIVDGVNKTLGDLQTGPLVDGTGVRGHNREEQGFPGLACAYVQFSKVFDGDKQTGVQVGLFGRFTTSYDSYRWEALKAEDRLYQMDDKEREEYGHLLQTVRRLEEAIKKDGISDDDHRYYYVPLDPIQPSVVSSESFIARAAQLNPESARMFFGKDNVDNKLNENGDFPKFKIAVLQDLKDTVKIIDDSGWLVEEAIAITPKKYWGRRGVTE